jgi:hypothetical protein
MTLLEQIQHDRYNEDEGPPEDRVKRQWFNLGSKHVEGLVRMHTGFVEIREAPAMDLRLRAEMTGVGE